jgi:transposase
MIEVYACDFSGNGVFVMFIADLLQDAPRNHKQEPPGFTGIGPTHTAKATHTAVAIDHLESEVGRVSVRATRRQVPQLLDWAVPLGEGTWAIESAGGMGYLLAQQLVAAGEAVVDVPATLASRIRVLGRGRSDKNVPNDALSVAVAVLRVSSLHRVAAEVCRLHNLLMELSPGGIAKELNASDAARLLERLQPVTATEAARRDLALDLLADLQHVDTQLTESHRRIRAAVAASGTRLTELFGVGPVIACYLIGFTGDVTRFADRDHYAAYNGTAPVERSSGPRVVHRASRRATVAATTPCTWPPSARSGIAAPRAAPTSNARWPRARPRKTPSDP